MGVDKSGDTNHERLAIDPIATEIDLPGTQELAPLEDHHLSPLPSMSLYSARQSFWYNCFVDERDDSGVVDTKEGSR